MNSLHDESLTWVGDGSEGNTLTQNGNDLVIASKSAGTPFNVRVDSEKAAEEYFWQATIKELKGSLSFGAVSKEEFKPGWKAKGMFFNGNLTNGSAGLKIGWGPRFQTGDTMGVRVSPTSDALEVSFYKNGGFLGTGFRLSNNTTTFYPCLHVSGSASLSIETPQQFPPTVLADSSPTGIYGNWKLDKAWDGENPVEFPNERSIQLEIAQEKGDKVRLSFKVANKIGGTAQVLDESGTTMTVKCGPFMATKMMPPPEFRAIETLISSKEISTLSLDENTLLVSGPELKTDWSPFIRAPTPLLQY